MSTLIFQIFGLAGFLVVLAVVITMVAVREAERRAKEEAAEAVFQAMAMGSQLRAEAWNARQKLHRLRDDVIDIDPDDVL